jgi:ligand-binding sensor domain-containing protein
MRIAVIWLSCCVPVWAIGQQIPIVRYGTGEGLGHPIVYRVFQDSNHLLWFGTDNGLTRYDGQRFKNYTSKDGLRSNFVFSITSYQNKLLCCTFGGGLQYFSGTQVLPDTMAFQQIKYPLNITPVDSGLWVIDKNSCYYWLDKNGCRKFTYPITDRRRLTLKILHHRGQTYATSLGMMRFNSDLGSFEEFNTGTFIDHVNTFNAIGLQDGGLLLATNKGLVVLSLNRTGRLVADIPFSYNTGNLYQLASGQVLVGGSDGSLWLFNKTLDASQRLLTGVVINDIAEDQWRHIWLCTYGQGVWKLPSLAVRQHPLENLISPDIYLDAQRKEVRVFSFNGLEYIIGQKGGPIKKSTSYNEYQQVGYASFFKNNSGERFFTTSSSIVKNDGRSDQLVYRANTTITQLYQDSDNQYWVGQKPGLLTGSDFASLRSVDVFSNIIVRCVVEGPNKTKYIGTDDGLYIMKPSGLQHIGAANGLKNLFVTSLLYDSLQQKLWIGTNDGLYGLNATGAVNTLLTDVRINHIVKDRYGNKWMAASWGLISYNQKYFQVFGREDGLQPNLIRLAYDSAVHQLHVLASENYYAINLHDYLDSGYRDLPQIKLMQQKINGVLLPGNGPIYKVSEKINQLFLEIAVPVYHNLLGHKLYYRVNGGTWVNANWASELNINNLYYGQHIVEIKVADEINNITVTSTQLTYHVQAPFWKTTIGLVIQFLLALTAGLTLLVLAGRYFNRRRIRRIKAEQRRMELEHKVLGNMLNPHFMNNALNAIQAFVVKNDQRSTLNYLSKFARLMRINLELLDKNSVTLDKEIQNLSLYLEFELLRNPELIEYTIEVAPGIDLAHITVPSLLLQPFVENAIWHGILPKKAKGTIHIGVARHPTGIRITIADDGVGLEASRNNPSRPASEKISKGLQIIADRLSLLNVTRPGHGFLIGPNQPKGTLVTVTIPL